MNYRLISETFPPVIHDYTSLFWGHNINQSGEPKIKNFKDLQTNEYDWFIWSDRRLEPGHFIKRNMQSGKIGLYEIISVEPCRGVSDMSFIHVIHCGYINNGEIEIGPTYGIEENPLTEFAARFRAKFGRKFKRIFGK